MLTSWDGNTQFRQRIRSLYRCPSFDISISESFPTFWHIKQLWSAAQPALFPKPFCSVCYLILLPLVANLITRCTKALATIQAILYYSTLLEYTLEINCSEALSNFLLTAHTYLKAVFFHTWKLNDISFPDAQTETAFMCAPREERKLLP